MNHYAYLLTFTNSMRYVGARSTKLSPELDASYLGSGTALPLDRLDLLNVSKVILATFSTREELMKYEKDFIIQNGCATSPEWYNQRIATFDRHGSIPWNKGLVVTNEVDSTFSATFSSRYKGKRSPAMLAAHAATAEKIRGTFNPDKGHKSISNCAFIPWYYVTPEGVYVEVHDKTKRELADTLGVTERQLINRFHHTNIHKVGRYPTLRGYIFGNLPRPTVSAES